MTEWGRWMDVSSIRLRERPRRRRGVLGIAALWLAATTTSACASSGGETAYTIRPPATTVAPGSTQQYSVIPEESVLWGLSESDSVDPAAIAPGGPPIYPLKLSED